MAVCQLLQLALNHRDREEVESSHRSSHIFFDRVYFSTKARSIRESPRSRIRGETFRPKLFNTSLVSSNMLGLPHSMARSSSGLIGGRPISRNSLPLRIRSVRRPWFSNGSRVTVG